MCNNKRRNFLKNIGHLTGLGIANHISSIAGLSGITLASLQAIAEDNKSDFNFVLFRVPGAMDSTYGLHPWVESNTRFDQEDLFLGYTPERPIQTKISGTEVSLGPAAKALTPFAKQMAILRGIYVGPNDLGHPFAIQHMSSGRTQESAPHWPAYLGNILNKKNHFIISNSAIQRGALSSFPMMLTQALPSLIDGSDTSDQDSLSVYSNPDWALSAYLDLQKQPEKINRFKEVMNLDRSQSARSDESIALAALVAGISRVAQIDIIEGSNLDTHAGHAQTHFESQKVRWDRIAKFLQGLRDHKIFEKTLVVVITEFNRTPGRNANGGKDHNYSDNAVALFGRNINGGRVMGDHTLYVRDQDHPYAIWAGQFLNYKTGQTVDLGKKFQGSVPKNIDLIRPADLWTSVTTSLTSDLRKYAPQGGKILPGLFLNT